MKISALCEHRCHLGEGPLWDSRGNMLYWVDSYAPRLYRYDYARRNVDFFDLPGSQVGSLAVREGGGLILALDQGFYRFDMQRGELDLVAEPLAEQRELRFNDGKVDPFGNFVAGGMNIDYRANSPCPVYRLGADLAVEKILDDFVCFNGPCFSVDGTRFYVTGRIDGAIEVFDYDAVKKPSRARILIDGINPDGATVDAQGYIWSAQWDDECLLRLSPEGEVDYRIDIAGHIVSSLTFGGPELGSIFVTTVGGPVHGAEPRAGDCGQLLVIEDSGFRGRPEPMFKG